MAKYKTLKSKKKGQKPVRFKEGGQHETLGIRKGLPIPAGEHQAALAGKRGALAKKQEIFKRNVLTGPKKGKKKSRKNSGY